LPACVRARLRWRKACRYRRADESCTIAATY